MDLLVARLGAERGPLDSCVDINVTSPESKPRAAAMRSRMIGRIHATVLFVRDLSACAAFYRDTLGFAVRNSDDNSVWFGDQQILLLQWSAATEMVGEDTLSAQTGAPRVLLCAEVEDVDATHAALEAKGITFVKPPTSQPWGLRTAHFPDPEGNLWEISHDIEARAKKLEAAAKG
jgi:catechol 2,3-dioxygenase-like lactoylglutathione lyase family enzyme